MIAAGNDKLFQRLTEVLEVPELATDPRFAANPDRVRHRDELVPLLEAALAGRGSAEWAARLDAAGVPCAPIATVEEALTSAQAEARDMVVELDHPTVGRLRTVGSPLKLGHTPARFRSAPPLTGRLVDGPEAVRLHLATASVPAADLDTATADLVAAITAHPPVAIRAAKRAVDTVIAPTRDRLGRLPAGPAADYDSMRLSLSSFLNGVTRTG